MNIVKYKVTHPLGLYEKDKIIEAIKIAEDSDSNVCLLYHPRSVSHGGCASLEFAQYDEHEHVYVSTDIVDAYININSGLFLKDIQESLNGISYKNTTISKHGIIRKK